MHITTTDLPGVLVLQPRVLEDDRGFFFESWNQRDFDEAVGRAVVFVQDNHSRSARGVLRGLHHQLPPHDQGKLVRCAVGAVWDVAVDIRRGSETFGRSVGVELTAANRRQLWIPEGFAHGFVALHDGAELLYKTTTFHAPDSDRAIAWDDPDLAIDWPMPRPPILSARDAAAPGLDDADLPDAGAVGQAGSVHP